MKGTVYWITGLSGAGKTTLSKAFINQLKLRNVNTVLLDGDELREMLGVTGAFTYGERKELAFTYSRLCALLSNQGINVVCATISMFDDVRAWNRSNIENYKEIYIKCKPETLKQRDNKGIYKQLLENKINNVAGFDIQIEEPKYPDLIIVNDGSCHPEQLIQQIHELK